MNKLLTIGMAVYDDFDGVYFSIQALQMYHLSGMHNDVEFIVIDNNPTSKRGIETKKFVETKIANGRYFAYTDKQSTSVRNEIFKHARGEYVLCIDPHVMFAPGSISTLLEYYRNNPNTKNLIHGPLWYDNLTSYSTHFDPVWRSAMYGIWATNKEAYEKGEAFEIPMMGLGTFSCKKSEWQWFNKNFVGFGAEEGYIHEKFRLAGGKCICIPQLKWIHRFGRPDGVPYKNTFEDRIFNYFVGWLELKKDENDPMIQSIFKEFQQVVSKEKIQVIFENAKKVS
jgi:glycosyltransferase involved in cell wall biosynthesis